MQRRNLLLGLGSATAASALLGSGAVTELTAERGIAIQVAQDSQGLIALQGTNSTNSQEYFSGSSNGALIDLGNPSNGEGQTGINYDSVAFFDDVFAVENRSADPLDVNIPVNNDADGDNSTFESNSELNVELYQGEQANDSITFVQNSSPLTLSVGESKSVGVKVEVPARDDLGDQDFKDLTGGDLSLSAETRRSTANQNPNQDEAISYQGGSPQVVGKDPENLDLSFTFDKVGSTPADLIRVKFTNDALVGDDVSSPAAADTVNIGTSSLDITDVREESRNRSDDSARILIELGDTLEQQTDNRDVPFTDLKVQLEDDDSSNGLNANVEVVLLTGDGSGSPDSIIASTSQRRLTDNA